MGEKKHGRGDSGSGSGILILLLIIITGGGGRVSVVGKKIEEIDPKLAKKRQTPKVVKKRVSSVAPPK